MNEVRFTLRLPAELAEALKREAEYDDRSLHAQVVNILRRHVEDTEKVAHLIKPKARAK
jgi:hypothetical protein